MIEENKRPTKNERRLAAREQARAAREAEKKREKRNKLFLQGGVVLGVIAILAVVGLVLMQSMKPAGPGPLNMASGGATFGANAEVVKGPALASDGQREASVADWESLPIEMTVYVDYMCPGCGNFEQTYGDMLTDFVEKGDVQLTVYPMNFLDDLSAGTKYSTRAANAFGCLVEQQPNAAFKFHNQLLSAGVQPAERTAGLSNDELIAQAELAGAKANTEFKQCVKDQRFASFFDGNTKQATQVALLGLAKDAQVLDGNGQPQPADKPQRLSSTPTVIVNGHQWVQQRDGGLKEFLLKYKAELEGGTAGEAESGAKTE